MPNRTIYLSEAQIDLWDDVRMLAQSRGCSAATVLLELFDSYISADTIRELREKRMQVKALARGRK